MHQIGIGVLGPLFRAADATGNVVAVKAFRLDLTPEQAQRFSEALHDVIGVGLSDPSIIPLLDAGTEGGIPYLVSECVTGNSLDVVLRDASGRPARTPEMVARIAAAIDGAHVRGVMHGALHLRDVIVDGEQVRVSGFGVANVLEHVGWRVPIRRPYAAPELVAGRHWGPEADRYAIAAIAYELLTGLRAAGSRDDVVARLRDLAGVDVADPAGLQQAFRNGLADDPSMRPPSAAQFAMAFGVALGAPPAGRDTPLGPSEAITLSEGAAAAAAAEPMDRQEDVEPAPSDADGFELVPEPANPDGGTAGPPDWSDEAEALDARDASGDNDDPRAAEGRPSGQRYILRSAAPVAIAIVVGIGLALALGMELGMPGGTARGSSPEAAPTAETGRETEALPAAPEPVAPPTVVDAVPLAAAPVETEAEPGTDAPAPAGPGSVYLDTRPPGAIVLIDGERVGVTPLLVPDVTAGAHHVRLELAGYLPWTTDVAVAAEEQVRVGASLQPDGSR